MKLQNKNTIKNGFTLIELIIVISTITILGSLAYPLYGSFQQKTSVQTITQDLVYTLRQAQTYARVQKNSTNWGVYCTQGKYILFQGSSYATRNQIFDDITEIPSYISFSGLSEIVFNQSGYPLTSGSLIIFFSDTLQQTIYLSSEGVINRG